jgi:hypothetical protein
VCEEEGDGGSEAALPHGRAMDLSSQHPRTRRAILLTVLAVGGAVLTVAFALPAPHRDVLPGGGPDFLDRKVTWAQGSTIHYGNRTFDVAPLVVHALRPSRNGLFLEVSDTARFDASTRWILFDGGQTTAVPGDVKDVVVAPSGNYAGWIDRDGPWRPAGRVAEVIVVDLRNGQVVFRSSSGMGGGFGDDLGARYENLPPAFLGFDRGSAYWRNATGSGERWRWHLSSDETERAERDRDFGEASTTPVGDPWDPQRGHDVWVSAGRPVPAPAPSGERGFLSPDGRFVLTEPVAKLIVTRALDGRRVHLHLDRFAWFGGWLDDVRFYALTRSRYEDGFDPTRPDRTTGTLVSCSLGTGDCTSIRDLTATRSVVMPGAANREHVF